MNKQGLKSTLLKQEFEILTEEQKKEIIKKIKIDNIKSKSSN